MPFFVDIFYPDNPKMRAEVANLRAEIRESYIDFKTEWNQFADALNNALKGSKYANNFDLPMITYDPDNDDVKDMTNDVNDAVKTANEQLQEFRDQLGNVKGFKELEVALKDNTATIQEVSNFLLLIGETTLGALASYYAYYGIRLVITFANLAGAGISTLAEILGGVLGGLIVGAAAVVISDIIISAIEGAIEKHKLKDAIEALTNFQTEVSNKISMVASDVGGQYNAINSGLYRLSSSLILVKVGSNQWKVINTSSSATEHALVDFDSNSVKIIKTPVLAA